MRGIAVSYETIREWCLKFGQAYANRLRRKAPRRGDQWHLDEVFLKINACQHYLWRATHFNAASPGGITPTENSAKLSPDKLLKRALDCLQNERTI